VNAVSTLMIGTVGLVLLIAAAVGQMRSTQGSV
jgi:hypothetical protein